MNLVPGESGRVTLSGTATGPRCSARLPGIWKRGRVALSAGGRLPTGLTLSLISEAGATLAQVGPGQGEATAELAAAVQAHVTLSAAAGTSVAVTLCLSLDWQGQAPDESIPVPVSTALYGLPKGSRDEWDAVTGIETRRCRLVEPGESSEVTVSEDPAIGSSHVGFNLTIPHKHTGDAEADVLCTHFVSKATGSTIEDIVFSLNETQIQLRMRTRILSLYGYDAGDPSTALPAFQSWIAAQKRKIRRCSWWWYDLKKRRCPIPLRPCIPSAAVGPSEPTMEMWTSCTTGIWMP